MKSPVPMKLCSAVRGRSRAVVDRSYIPSGGAALRSHAPPCAPSSCLAGLAPDRSRYDTHVRRGLLILAGLLLVSGAALAEDDQASPLVPLPSVPDYTPGSGWGVALGAGFEVEPAYDGSDEYEVEPDLAGGVHWRAGDNLFFWEGLEIGWRGLAGDRWLLQSGVEYEEGLEPDESDKGALDGIGERDSHLSAFFEVRRSIGDDWRHWVAARLLGGPSDFGWLGVLAAGRRFGSQQDGTGTELYVYSTFATSDFINKDFGVTAADSASSGLPPADFNGGYRSIALTLIDRRNLSDNLQLVSQAGYEQYSSDIQDSPIARDDHEFELGVSLLWRFGD